MSISPATPSPRAFYGGVFLISAVLMSMQVIETRIFSVTTWYHLSFLIISVAMFGLTLGALAVHRGNEAEQRADCAKLAAKACVSFTSYTLLALMAQMVMPVMSSHVGVTLLTLPAMAACVIPPYYFAGVALSLAITRGPYPVARIYGFDLLGAAAGCLLALGLMELIDAPSAMLLISAAGFAAAALFDPVVAKPARSVARTAAALLLLNVALPQPILYPIWSKDQMLPERLFSYDKWNSISRVTVSRELTDVQPPLWGPSRLLPEDFKTSIRALVIDGNAGTAITKFDGDCGAGLDYLDYDLTTVAYALPDLKTAAIIGVGGGRDALSACHAGIKDISAVDVNNIQISLLANVEPYRSYAKIADIPGMKLIHAEARSWLVGAKENFDIIQMSMIDTWAATGAGAFALSENGLYTTDAWKTFLVRLNPHGVLTVSRWYVADAPNEVQRMMSLAAATLLESGAKAPATHVFLAIADNAALDSEGQADIATLVVGRDPLTDAQIDAMEERVRDKSFRILASPRQGAEDATINAILAAKTVGELQRLSDANYFDISPPDDQRPFFFNQVRLTEPRTVFDLAMGYEQGKNAGDLHQSGTLGGHARATINLYIIIAFAVLAAGGVILFPLRTALKTEGHGLPIVGGTLWFLLIGIGFMFLEISLLQRMSVYLGHPAWGLGIVLFSIVLATGLGSLVCDRFPLTTTARKMAWITAVAGLGYAEIFLLNGMITHFDDAPFHLRAALCVGMILPLGMLLGYGFPTGLAMAKGRGTAWLWGINGAASVTGSALAVASNIAFGINQTMMAGAICYALLVVPALMMGGRSER